jgi:N6-L-threonylcarbamoyladenine synthase
MYFLAIESSCDETAAAVFDEEPKILANVVASQAKLHERFGGVVPEVAARAHLQRLVPVIDDALKQAGIALRDIEAIAVMNTPGLVGSLLVGVSAAKMLAVALDVPLLAAGCEVFPAIGLVVSGGHTCLFECRSALNFRLLGATIDDAAGEAFDKVASILGLGFPGGPLIEKAARTGNPKRFAFPRAFLRDPHFDFSFSGLKTAVLYAHRDLAKAEGGTVSEQTKADLAASFQQAVIDVLVGKCRQALEQTGLENLCVGGGVAANQPFRQALQKMTEEHGWRLFIPPMSLCTDNAAMAAMAVEKWRTGQLAPLDLDAYPTYMPSAAPVPA